MTPRRDPSKFLQIGFLVLLLILLVLAGYWIYDHVSYTQDMREQLRGLYDAQTDSAKLAALDRQTDIRINRILWEGGFFLAVLLGGLTVITRAIGHDAELRRRQQNFLAAVSHEFKSPLASIRLAAETLVMRSDSAETKRLAERILADDERLLRMVENLLDTTRLEEGRHPLTPEPTALGAVARTAIDAMAARASHADVTIVCDVPDELSVSADPKAVETIFNNLLDNSLNACVAGSGHNIEVSGRRTASGVEFAVKDDGVGFPPADGELIFEKFYRAGDEMRRTTPGSGLGLYIVRRLAEMSGARISATSPGPGQGALFTLTWAEDK
jgi:signal transduction histidine kinase